MSAPTVFLRKRCLLPPGLHLPQIGVNEDWNSVMGLAGWELSACVQARGWHCMWLSGGFSTVGLGRTVESASSKAIQAGLHAILPQFNAAEIEMIRVASYNGFSIARVKIHARQIQQDAMLSLPKASLKEHDDSQRILAEVAG
jgi:hypothetical protein